PLGGVWWASRSIAPHPTRILTITFGIFPKSGILSGTAIIPSWTGWWKTPTHRYAPCWKKTGKVLNLFLKKRNLSQSALNRTVQSTLRFLILKAFFSRNHLAYRTPFQEPLRSRHSTPGLQSRQTAVYH